MIYTQTDAAQVAAALARFGEALNPTPASQGIQAGLMAMAQPALAYASAVTHRDTDTLSRSYLIDQGQGSGGAYASIYIDPSIQNPRGQSPAVYGPMEFARGGDHDAFGRAFQKAEEFVREGVALILDEAAKAGRQ